VHRFAAFLDRGSSETINARVRRMSQSTLYPVHLKDALEAIALGLRATGAVKPSGAVYELLSVFGGRPGASVDDFCAAICRSSAPVAGNARRFKTANPAVANDIFLELEPLLDSPERVQARLAILSTSSLAGTATWTLVANRVIGDRRTYRDRNSAIRAIVKHVESRLLLDQTDSDGGRPRPQ
jgi:hypothetical protein